MKKYNYYEIGFGTIEEEEYWMVIKGVRRPTVEEAQKFCAKDSDMYGLNVCSVLDIDETTARGCYDFSNEDQWPIFGLNEPITTDLREVKLTMFLTIEDTPEAIDAIKRLTHHAEYFLNLEEYPEVKSVYGVEVKGVG